MKILLPIAWTAWTMGVLVLLYGLFAIATERSSSPEAPRGLGVAVVFLVLLCTLALGWGIRWSAQRQAQPTLLIITSILVFPYVMLVAGKGVSAFKERLFDAEAAKEGDFRDPALKPLAAAILAADPVALKQALAGRPVPAGADRAGNSLLHYALRRYRFYNGSLPCIQVLLAAGADPNVEDPSFGAPPIFGLDGHPDALRTFVEAGANINALSDGLPAVVSFTSTRHWDAALYLVEKGARLDLANAHGVSLDYYLNDWKDSVFGEHPEGWDRLRAAIAKRRK